MSTQKISKIEEKKFRRDIKSFLEDASKIENPTERLQELQEIVTYFDNDNVAQDLKEQVKAKIFKEQQEINNLISDAAGIKKVFGDSNPNTLKTGVAIMAEEVQVSSAEAKDWQKIAEALNVNNNKLKKVIETKNKKLSEVDLKIKMLESDLSVAELDKERTLEAASLESESKDNETNEKTIELEKVKENLLQAKLTLKEKNASIKLALKETLKVEKIKNKLLKESAQLKKQQIALKRELRESKSVNATKLKESRAPSGISENEKRLITENEILRANLKEATDSFDNHTVKSAKDTLKGYVSFKEKGGAAVETYWADLVTRHGPSINLYERQIRSCKTYREASTAYLRILPLLSEENTSIEQARLPESNSITRQERRRMLEKSGMKFGNESMINRMPLGWN